MKSTSTSSLKSSPMSSNLSSLERLEALLTEEFEVLASGDFQRLGELLCEKLHLVENLPPEGLDPDLARRCWRMNRQLLGCLGIKDEKRSTYRR